MQDLEANNLEYHKSKIFKATEHELWLANKLLSENSISFKNYPDIKYESTVSWNDTSIPRSQGRLLNGFEFIECLIKSYALTSDKSYLEKGFRLVEDFSKNADYTKKVSGSMAFHDETTSMRVVNWIRFLSVAVDVLNPGKIELLCGEINKTLALLATDEFFVGNNNHGMFQSLALLKGSLLFSGEMPEQWRVIAQTRLDSYFSTSFTEDGIHNEHSPSYHLMVLRNLEEYISISILHGLKYSLLLSDIIEKAKEYPRFFTRFDGTPYTMGDTEPKPPQKQIQGIGRVFKPYMKTGYVFIKDEQIKLDACFSASFHHMYHKHNDDLQFLLYLDGDVLVDPGNPGYQYENPFVKYGRSYRAHNTLCVDGGDLPRNLKDYHNVKMQISEGSDKIVIASGCNKRHIGITHKRKIQYIWDEAFFEIMDNVKSNEKHDYIFTWHFAEDLKFDISNDKINVLRNEKLIAVFSIFSNEEFSIIYSSGREAPYIQGYTFSSAHKPVPIPTIEVEFKSCSMLQVMTTIQICKKGDY